MCQLYLLSGIWVCDAQECGRAPIIDGKSGIEDRIVGGTDAVQGAWPWQVDIQVSPSGSDSIPVTSVCVVLSLSLWLLMCRCVVWSSVGLVCQTDLLREGFACDAELTHPLCLPYTCRNPAVMSVEVPLSQGIGSCRLRIASLSKKKTKQN